MSAEPFVWGVATSAYQIEGGRHEGGKGPSIWDKFSDTGRMSVTGDVATDHYHRLEEDLDLLASLGVGAYRFSTAWTRVIPDGDGEVSPEGLAFYRRLVDGLADRGITPWLTLYHWDLPLALQEKGGWGNRSTIDAFARYAAVVSEALGDGVGHWITHNEPWVATFLGHLYGIFAPGLTDWGTALTAAHNILVSHGRAVSVIREKVKGASVGIALDCRPARPATSADLEATRHFDGFRNRWFFDPVFGKGYPSDMLEDYGRASRLDPAAPEFVGSDDMETIAAPIDFVGLNYYTTLAVRAGMEERDDPERDPGPDPDPTHTEMGWAIDPSGLRDYLLHIDRAYAPGSIVVTENGASFSDGPGGAGRIADVRRIAYLRSHIEAVAEAAEAGAPVDGYFVWSFLDNLEWTSGFDQRFGLVWVDPGTLDRIPKESFDWYRGVVDPHSEQSRRLAAARSRP